MLLLYDLSIVSVSMKQSFFVIFLGVQGKEIYFFGSISMLEIILWVVGSYPSLSAAVINMYEHPPWDENMAIFSSNRTELQLNV